MDGPYYDFTASDDATVFWFKSTNGDKIIEKEVRYTATFLPDMYSLALVDVLSDGTVSDVSRPRQGDVEKVLATVIQTIHTFLATRPTATVAFAGSTDARTRLYQIAIVRELSKVESAFVLQGYLNGAFENFVPGTVYAAFAIRLKQSKS